MYLLHCTHFIFKSTTCFHALIKRTSMLQWLPDPLPPFSWPFELLWKQWKWGCIERPLITPRNFHVLILNHLNIVFEMWFYYLILVSVIAIFYILGNTNNEYIMNTMGIDSLVFYHLDISIQSVEYTFHGFPVVHRLDTINPLYVVVIYVKALRMYTFNCY